MEKWLNNNKLVGVIAVLLAILLWVVVHLDDKTSTATPTSTTESKNINEVQITTVGLNEQLFSVRSIDPAYVNIVLRGKESAVNQVRFGADGSQIQLDLSGISQAGEETINLKAVGFPNGLDVAIYPSVVKVEIEEIQNKEVPIQIDIKGKPSEGFIVGSPIINPVRAVVSVPKSRADQIVAVRAVVDISDADEAVEVTGKLTAINQDGDEVEAVIAPAVVQVNVPITSPFKTIPLQVNLINQPADGYSVTSIKQSVNEVTIYGPHEALADIDVYPGIDIDLTGLSSNQKFSFSLPLMDRIHLINPSTVEVELEIVPSSKMILENIPIVISGANEDYVTQIIDPETGLVDVIIEGAPNVLNGIKEDDIQAIVDVSNQPVGIHEFIVKLNLPSNVSYGGDEELRVTIEIKPFVEDEGAMTDINEENDEGTVDGIDDPPPEGETE